MYVSHYDNDDYLSLGKNILNFSTETFWINSMNALPQP